MDGMESMRFDDMGRKRKKFGEQRQPISISLPRNLIMDLDRTLDDEHSRSRLFERLLKQYLQSNTKLSDFQRHLYHCLDCDRQFHINRYMDPILLVCRGNRGCGGVNIEYDGILGEEE